MFELYLIMLLLLMSRSTKRTSPGDLLLHDHITRCITALVYRPLYCTTPL
jgi:hypothetical protein